jgi:hypothetical protein
MNGMITSVAAASALAAVSLVGGAGLSFAADQPRPAHTHVAASARLHGHVRPGPRQHHPMRGIFAGPLRSDIDEGGDVPGSWHVNGNGAPYQVPYPCAYPLGADDAGIEHFQTFGCPLP